MIFQEPMVALDPVFTIGEQIAETIVRHEGAAHAAAWRRARDLLEMVQIPSATRRLKSFPHELSGGMRQRAMIALALSCRPAVLLADEPTTALDVTVQIQIIVLLRQLQRELGMAVVFVTHDVGVAVEVADRLAVMYAGRFVETGPTETVIERPAHPYTAALLTSTVLGAVSGHRLEAITGTPPDVSLLPMGCSFAPRCRFAVDACCRWRDSTDAARPRRARFGVSRYYGLGETLGISWCGVGVCIPTPPSHSGRGQQKAALGVISGRGSSPDPQNEKPHGRGQGVQRVISHLIADIGSGTRLSSRPSTYR